MAIGKASDMIIYQEQFQTGMVERVTQFLQVFNEGTRGAIRLIPNALKGDYSKGAFFKDVASLVTRRDTTSTASVTDLALAQGEQVSVKINRKVGPVAQTLDAMKKAGLTIEDASRAFGQLAGERKMKDMVDAAIRAGVAAAKATSALVSDVSSTSAAVLATPSALNTAASLFGDAAQDIVCWVAHSKPNFDIIGGLVAGSTTGLADVATIQGSLPGYLGRPAVITDSAALTFTDTLAKYNTLGLVKDGIIVEESEEESFLTMPVSGLENIVQRWQSEHAFNIKIKGYTWDVTNGGANPNDTALALSTNWDKVAYDNKLLHGVCLVTN